MKSHVSMEQHVCIVCGQPYDSGALLLDRRLRPSMEDKTVTGWGLCPEHKEKHEAGYVALVEVDPERSGSGEHPPAGTVIKPEDAYRTGRLLHVRRAVWGQVFNVPVPAKPDGTPLPLCFVPPQVFAHLGH